MLKYFVRTTNQRNLDETYSQIDYELLINHGHDPIGHFIANLEVIAAQDVDAVILEDDLVLCQGFKEKVERVIKNNSNMIINFYSEPDYYFQTEIKDCLSWNQCVYYPKEQIHFLMEEMKKRVAEQNLPSLVSYSRLQTVIMREHGIKVLNCRPCYVQHLNYNTTVFIDYSFESINKHFNNDRRTPFFEDYLNQLGIDYNNKEEVLHRFKELRALLKQFVQNTDFNKYIKNEQIN